MQAAPPSPKIRPKILLLFLILAIPLLILGPLLLIMGARNTYEQAIGHHLNDMAEQSQLALSNYLQHRILQVAGLTTVPQIRRTVEQSNQAGMSTDQLQKRIQSIEALWQGMIPENSRTLREILENPASQFLRRYQEVIPLFREILVTDARGLLVAATNKPSDYFQADEHWWLTTYREGVGGHFISDIQFDASANVYALEVAAPIMDHLSGSVLGIIKVIVDSQDIFSLVNSINLGKQGHAFLMNGDGRILISRDLTAANQELYPHAGVIQRAVSTQRLFLEAGSGEEKVFLGLPNNRLKDTFPELDWYLLVQMPSGEAFSAVNQLYSWFIYIVLFTVATAFVLALLFSWLLSRPVIEVDPHLEEI